MSLRLVLCLLLLSITSAVGAHAQCNNDFILVGTLDAFGGTPSAALLDPITKTATTGVEPLSATPTLRAFGGRVFVLSDDNKLRILDPCNGFNAFFNPLPTGGPSTPRDLVQVSPTLAYITRYERSGILKVNPVTGLPASEINLGPLADADGLPEMNQMFASGGRMYVCLERTTHATGALTGTSMLGVIDIATEAIVDMDPGTAGMQGIPLLLQKPNSEINFRVRAGAPKAYFSCTGVKGVLDGGVIECDMGNPANQSVLLTESTTGGDIVDVEIVSDTNGFAIVQTPSTAMELIAFNPSTGAKIGPTMFAVGGDPAQRFLSDCEPSSLGLLLSDLNVFGAAGIRCFDMTTNLEIPGGPISLGFPPFDILVKKGATTDVGDASTVAALGQNYPNPFNPETSIPFSLTSASHVTMRIYDVNGEFVATLLDENREPGEHIARWDGRDARGGPSSSGIYFARLQANGTTETRKIALLK
jgi:hypothetical protein